MFKNLQINHPIYILYKGDTIEAKQGKVVAITPPRIDSQMFNGIQQPSIMVVDITIECDGTTKTYTMPDSLNVTYAGNTVLSVDREGIIRETETIKSNSEGIVNSVSKHKKIIDECEEILQNWNPALKEKKENEQRLQKLEGTVAEVRSMLSSFIKELKG